ncbi:MAG: hypothetical protein JW864_00155 [Spirochaetes bacterium]|nr:hypothetical protein [Spirochaetota bacterium]
MKIGFKVLSLAAIVAAIVLFGYPHIQSAHSKIITNVPSDISAQELRAIVIEDFEKTADWQVESTPKKNPDPKKDPVPSLQLKYLDGAPSDLTPERWTQDKKGMEAKKILGLHFRFKYPGFNSVHIIPPPEVQWDDQTKKVMTYDSRVGKYVQERAIQLPGQSRGLSMWVHGRGNDYYLEAWVKDWKGEVHIIKFGSMNFVGWRPLVAQIPPYIPQEIESYPQTKLLKIVRFVIRSTPDSITEDTYMFFDQLKVLTDVFEVNFDGQDLHKAFEEGGSGSSSEEKPSEK